MDRVPLPKTSTRAVPPWEVAAKMIDPPCPPPDPPLAISVLLPALDALVNLVTPTPALLNALPLLVMIALAAVVNLPPNSIWPPSDWLTPPLLVKVPLPAVELSEKATTPPPAPLTAPPLLVKVPLPALALPP